ncbi:MAG: hypothetical protein IT384_01400 [Deltaproteobacteria bacterium]|nr:hypothetical protein [Deltaproteobacteria bacterium]
MNRSFTGLRAFVLGSLAASLLGACESPPQPIDNTQHGITPADVTRISTAHLHEHLAGLWQALAMLSDSELAQELDVDVPLPDDFDEESREIADELAARLFDARNVEASDSRQVVYLLRADVTCVSPDGHLDADCARVVGQVPIRLAVSSPASEALDIALEIGAARHRPATLSLQGDRTALRLDLAAARAALEVLAPALELEPEVLAFSARGEVSLELLRTAASAYRSEARVLSDVALEAQVDRGGISLQIAASSAPIAAVSVDGVLGAIEAQVALGGVDAAAPSSVVGDLLGDDWSQALAEVAPAGTFSAHLAGFTGEARFTADSDEIRVRGLGLGDGTSRIALDGADLVTFDVNPADGRRFDLRVTAEDSALVIGVAPSLELRLVTSLERLVHPLVEIPIWLRAEALGLRFDGASEPSVRFPNGGDAAAPAPEGELPPPPVEPELFAEIISGTLTLSAASRTEPLVATGGQCLWVTIGADGDTHPLDALFGDACP